MQRLKENKKTRQKENKTDLIDMLTKKNKNRKEKLSVFKENKSEEKPVKNKDLKISKSRKVLNSSKVQVFKPNLTYLVKWV
jgi:hypothetical protein